MSKFTPYILEKDGVYYSFPSERAACEYLDLPPCSLASVMRSSQQAKGYKVIRAIPEEDLYADERLHKIWESMHERCKYKKHMYYKDYGGRGITICSEWEEYLPFAKWARNNGYADNLTIDRIDVNGNYEPSNCRWVTMKEQHNNKRNNRIILYHGETYTLTQLAEKAGINKTTLKERLNLGWSIEDAVNRPIRQRTKGFRPSGAKMAESKDKE